MVKLSLRDVAPGGVLVVRDTGLRPLRTVVADPEALVDLAEPGRYVFDLHAPDGRLARATLEILPTHDGARLTLGAGPGGELRIDSAPDSGGGVRDGSSLAPPPANVNFGRPTSDGAPDPHGGLPETRTRSIDLPLTGVVTRLKHWLDRGSRPIAAESSRLPIDVAEPDAVDGSTLSTRTLGEAFGGWLGVWTWRSNGWGPCRLELTGEMLVVRDLGGVGLLHTVGPTGDELLCLAPIAKESRLTIDRHGRPTLQQDPNREALLTFLDHGDRIAAAALADRLVHAKVEDPLLAAAGAYYLLANGRASEIPRAWSTLVPWLPDGAIASAWCALDQGRLDAAHDLLLDGVRRGLPLFTRGLVLAMDGLSLFAKTSDAAKQARRWLAPYLAAARRDSSLTAFSGASFEEFGLRKEHPDLQEFFVPLDRWPRTLGLTVTSMSPQSTPLHPFGPPPPARPLSPA